MAQPTILLEGDMKTDRLRYRIYASTVLEAGDLVYASVGYVFKVANVTHDALFCGVVNESSASTESASVTVLQHCILDIDVTSATYNPTSGLKYTSANTLVDDGGAGTLAWAAERGSGVTRLRVTINVPVLQKIYEVNA